MKTCITLLFISALSGFLYSCRSDAFEYNESSSTDTKLSVPEHYSVETDTVKHPPRPDYDHWRGSY